VHIRWSSSPCIQIKSRSDKGLTKSCDRAGESKNKRQKITVRLNAENKAHGKLFKRGGRNDRWDMRVEIGESAEPAFFGVLQENPQRSEDETEVEERVDSPMVTRG